MESPPLPGKIQHIAVGLSVVAVTMDDGKVWLRSGVGQGTYGAQTWTRIPGSMKQVSVCVCLCVCV